MEGGGLQGEAKIVAPSACAALALPNSVVQALVSAVCVDDVQVVGAIRRRMMVRPRSLFSVPYKAVIWELGIGPYQASEAPKPRIVWFGEAKSTVTVLAVGVGAGAGVGVEPEFDPPEHPNMPRAASRRMQPFEILIADRFLLRKMLERAKNG
jgi:hypothetical protein